MLKLTNISADPIQEHILDISGTTALLRLTFLPAVKIWVINVEYGTKTAKGVKLALGVLHLRSYNFPFDFVLDDTSKSGIDPFRADDFAAGRVVLYMLTPEEMEETRGYPVEI
jgi:hypothetical protein